MLPSQSHYFPLRLKATLAGHTQTHWRKSSAAGEQVTCLAQWRNTASFSQCELKNFSKSKMRYGPWAAFVEVQEVVQNAIACKSKKSTGKVTRPRYGHHLNCQVRKQWAETRLSGLYSFLYPRCLALPFSDSWANFMKEYQEQYFCCLRLTISNQYYLSHSNCESDAINAAIKALLKT